VLYDQASKTVLICTLEARAPSKTLPCRLFVGLQTCIESNVILLQLCVSLIYSAYVNELNQPACTVPLCAARHCSVPNQRCEKGCKITGEWILVAYGAFPPNCLRASIRAGQKQRYGTCLLSSLLGLRASKALGHDPSRARPNRCSVENYRGRKTKHVNEN